MLLYQVRKWILTSFTGFQNETPVGESFSRPWVEGERDRVVTQVSKIINCDRIVAEVLLEVVDGIRTYKTQFMNYYALFISKQ